MDLEIPWRADLGAGLARQPAIGAPHAGSVVYVADDGAGSEVRRVEIATGARESLATLADVVWDIAVTPDGSTAYAAIVSRADMTRDLGVVRILLDGSGSVEHFQPPAPLGAAGDVRSVAVLAFQVQLATSSDGAHLVRRTCAEAGSCLVQVIEVATGRVLDLPDLEVLGVAGGAIVMRRCGVDTCRLEAIDIRTGAILSGGIDLHGHVVEARNDAVVVGILPDATERIIVEAVDPASGVRNVLYRAPEGADVIPGDFLDLHMDVPDGFVHVVEMPRNVGGGGPGIRAHQTHLLISVVDGSAIEIPQPAFHLHPGSTQQG